MTMLNRWICMYVLGPIFDYLKRVKFSLTNTFNKGKNVDLLESQIFELEKKREEIETQVRIAESNREAISERVSSWLRTVPNILKQSQGVVSAAKESKAFEWMFLKSFEHLRTTAADVMDELKKIEDKLQEGSFDGVTAEHSGYLPLMRDRVLVKHILEKLQDEKVSIVGVYGVDGVGKTTIIDKLMEDAKIGRMFNTVSMAVVSKIIDVKRIQDEIAGGIAFSIDEPHWGNESERSAAAASIDNDRAKKLRKRLKIELQEKKRVLICLDSIWTTNLQDLLKSVGIPNGCKIVLSARTKEECGCNQMGAAVEFLEVQPLSTIDAWNLFKFLITVSHRLEVTAKKGDLNDIAKIVVKSCGGIALAIKSVAKALVNHEGNRSNWEKVYDQLAPSGSAPNDGNLVSRVLDVIIGSFTESKDLIMSLFHLCCLFPGNSAIGMEELVRYGMGLSLFPDDTTINSINTGTRWAQELQYFNLLMDRPSHSDGQAVVRMHESIRLAAISLSSPLREDQKILVETNPNLKEWNNKNSFDKYYAISIVLSSRGVQTLPEKLICSKLRILRLECCSFRSNFYFFKACFDQMTNLQVLVIKKAYFWKQERFPYLESIKSLKTLCLDGCIGVDDLVSKITSLTSLEILSLRGSDISKVPEGLGQLTRLRVLDLTWCHKLVILPPKVIASLCNSLQGLYMLGSFNKWDTDNAASLRDLVSLSKLKVLQLEITVDDFPQDLDFIKDLAFCFTIKNVADGKSLFLKRHIYGDLTHCYGSKLKVLDMQNISTGDLVERPSLIALLTAALDLQLYKVTGLESIASLTSSCKNWKNLTIDSCDDLEYLIINRDQDTLLELNSLELRSLPNLKHIYAADIGSENALSNLTVLYIFDCHQLESLPLGSWGQFPEKLKSLGIWCCGSLKSIFIRPNETGEIALPNLERLRIHGAHKLGSFFSPPPQGSQSFFSEKDSLPALKYLEIARVKLENIWGNNIKEKSFSDLETILISYCTSLKELIPFSLLSKLRKLKDLKISYCDNLTEICPPADADADAHAHAHAHADADADADAHAHALDYIPLKELTLTNLARLTHINVTDYLVIKSLCSVSVGGCPILVSLFSTQVAKALGHLKCLEIAECKELQVVFDGSLENTEDIELPQLRKISLYKLGCLQSFCTRLCHVKLPMLESLEIIGCPALQRFSSRPMEKKDTEKLSYIKLSGGKQILVEELNAAIKSLRQQALGKGEAENQLEEQLSKIEVCLKHSYDGRRINSDPICHGIYMKKIQDLVDKLKALKDEYGASVKIRLMERRLKSMSNELTS